MAAARRPGAARRTYRLTLACAPHLWLRNLGGVRAGTRELELAPVRLPPREVFARALRGEFDVCELSLSAFLLQLARGDDRLVGIPVFPYRAFRHSILWVREGSGIDHPADLAGRRVGIERYAATALVFLRGLLKDEFGVTPEAIEWLRTGVESPAVELPDSIRLLDGYPAHDLHDLLASGVLDAIAAFWSLRALEAGAIRRLFPDVRAVESDYYRRTGIYPIMHLIALRRALYERDPALAELVARALDAARRSFEDEIEADGVGASSLAPWSYLDLEFRREVFGRALDLSGLDANRTTLAAAVRYMREQGLVERELALEELFAPEAVAVFDGPLAASTVTER